MCVFFSFSAFFVVICYDSVPMKMQVAVSQLCKNANMILEPEHQKIIYLVRYAEATHNILEREAVQAAIAHGIYCKCQQESVRKSVLQNPLLKDAPLSDSGRLQVRQSSMELERLTSSSNSRYQPPQVVLVSPLRRALMTATELFHSKDSTTTTTTVVGGSPRFVALEILREKRTGLACDERSSVEELEREFPHVDFGNLRAASSPNIGETNEMVRQRARYFTEEILPNIKEEYVAIISHKGWLRELRNTIKGWVDDQQLEVDFDLRDWHQTLYGNAEIRVADFGWLENRLVLVVSRSIDNAISSIVACSVGGEETKEG